MALAVISNGPYIHIIIRNTAFAVMIVSKSVPHIKSRSKHVVRQRQKPPRQCVNGPKQEPYSTSHL